MKITPSMMLNIILLTTLSASFFLVNTTATAPQYDPWKDVNEDGYIEMMDFWEICQIYGTSGTPINKTALLLDLLDRVETLETMITSLQTRCRIIPNGDFEKGIAGMEYNDIIDWNYSLIVGYAPYGNPPIGEAFCINDTHYYNRFQSLYTYLKTKSVYHPQHPQSGHDSVAYHYLSTEEPVFTTANYISLWIAGYTYTTSSRFMNHVELILTDGNETYVERLRFDGFVNAVGHVVHYNHYNGTEIGNDGATWDRYTRQIPEYLDKSNLTVKIQHYQAAWDLTTTESGFYLDNIYFSDANGNPVL